MFILASKHRAIVAELTETQRTYLDELERMRERVRVAEEASVRDRELADYARADYHALSLRVAEFADRALPPPRVKDVKQPRSVDEADAGVAKKLRLQGKA